MSLPEKFLVAAQQQGLADKLDLLILQSAIQRAVRHTPAHCTFHVNVYELNEALVSALPQSPALIALELSEHQMADDAGLRFVAACRSRGYRVGLSHFGSGRVPLRVLAEMRPDFVKISAADIRARGGKTNAEYVRTIVDQAHQLSAFVIAEAVETQFEREWLTASGVDALQGFEISSPLAEEDFFIWLRRYS
jgi:EAL domain-containing protein (putative c-di-GMP-specific phosphodiesterase class I)